MLATKRPTRSVEWRGALRHTSRGARTRSEILQVATDVASARGLEGLTIGGLAVELGMSKSGLIAHFGSKEDLQLAAVEAARAIFMDEVVVPALVSERGLARLAAMVEAWVSYIERGVFRGGCFFQAASGEFDGRPGRVRDRVAELTRAWLQALEQEAEEARGREQIARDTDPAQLAYELHALVQEANWAYQLLGDERAFARTRAAVRHRLGSVGVKPAQRRRATGRRA